MHSYCCQIARGADVVTAGAGFTDCVITVATPRQELALSCAVTTYCIVCLIVWLGSVSTSVIVVPVGPLPGLAPVIFPGLAPIVHVKLLGILPVRPIDVDRPLHIADGVAVVTAGAGCTVLVIVFAGPKQPFVDSAVTRYCTASSVK